MNPLYGPLDEEIDAALSEFALNGSIHILVVDHESSMRELIGEALKEAGYEVDIVENAREALEQLGRKHYDVLLADHDLPQNSGKDLIRQMRAEGICDVAAILMTGEAWEVLERYPDLQTGEILSKPFLIDDLLNKVADSLHVAQPAFNYTGAAFRGQKSAGRSLVPPTPSYS